MADKYRVQLDLTPEAFEELEKLRKEVDASTRADAIRRAMRILRWTLDQISSGARILVDKDNELKEVVFPFLPRRPEPERVRPSQDAASQWVDRGKDVIAQKKDQIRAAIDSTRQAYREASGEGKKNP